MNLYNICNLSRHTRQDSYHRLRTNRATPNNQKQQQKQSQLILQLFAPQRGHTTRKTPIFKAQEIQTDVISPQNESDPPKKKEKKQLEFTNVLKFKMNDEVVGEFKNIWKEREEAMRDMPGFVSFGISEHDENIFVVSNEWGSRKAFEDWAISDVCRRTHLPVGVYQFVPKKGEGFPEDFVPFVDMNEPVNAKY